MEKLDIAGGEFVKAKKVAREFGYTSDYIGQLCRAGKVEGKLVGRTWYVERNSLINYRNRRYQKDTSPATSKKTSSKEADIATKVPRFYSRAHNVSAQYDLDDASLLPPLNKAASASKAIKVSLADAKEVKVEHHEDDYKFETPQVKKTLFKGDLLVESIPEIEFSEVNSLSDEPNQNNQNSKKILVNSQKLEKSEEVEIRKISTVSGVKKKVGAVVKKRTEIAVHEVSTPVANLPEEPKVKNYWIIISGVLLGVLVGFFILSVEQQIITYEQKYFSEYKFMPVNLFTTISFVRID